MQKARLLDGILAFCIFYNYGEKDLLQQWR
mgnify:CR=1 FL=1